MNEPSFVVNYWAVFSASMAFFALGWIWYGPLFGKQWVNEMGGKSETRPDTKVLVRAIILNLIGCLFTSYVLAHMVQVWRPSVWHIAGLKDLPDYYYGLMASLFAWGGFCLPILFTGVAYEKRTWKFFSINAFYYLTGLIMVGQILTYWR